MGLFMGRYGLNCSSTNNLAAIHLPRGCEVIPTLGQPVTQTQAGVNGLHDMGAKVWQWASDARGDERRTLGGSWRYLAYQMKADSKLGNPLAFMLFT